MLLCYMLDAGAIWDAKLSEINSWFSNLYGTFMSIRPKKKEARWADAALCHWARFW